MTNKWDSEFTVDKLRDQIVAAKNEYQKLHWKVLSVECRESVREVDLTFELKKEYKLEDCHEYTYYTLDIYNFKIFKNKTDEEIEKVSLLGERAIQWKDLDIEIGLNDLLMSIQLRENWLNNLNQQC